MTHYIHHVPGRLRVKSPSLKKNINAEYELKKLLGTMSGIATVDINLTTGSLLIYYNPKVITGKDILNLLQKNGYFDMSKAVTNDQYIHAAVSKIGKIVWKSIFGAVVDDLVKDSPLSIVTSIIL